MGYVTPVLLYNDSMHLMEHDPTFPERLHDAAIGLTGNQRGNIPIISYRPKSFWSKIAKFFGLWKPSKKDWTGSASFAQILAPQHADTFRLLAVWGNTWTDIVGDSLFLDRKASDTAVEYFRKSLKMAKREIFYCEKRLREYEVRRGIAAPAPKKKVAAKKAPAMTAAKKKTVSKAKPKTVKK